MKDIDPPPNSATIRWVALARQRWPVGVASLVVLLVTVLALSRRGHQAGSAAEADASDAPPSPAEAEGIDSVVALDSTALQLAGIELSTVRPAGGGDLVANGTITYDANHVSVVAPRAEGRVVEVRADLGARVAKGAVLALLESREVGQTRGELERARASLDVAQNSYEREKRLYEQSISSQKEMLEAQGAYKTALAEYNSAVAQIRGLGARTGEGGVYGLTSPLRGIVVERNAMPGQIVGPSTNLFTVADLARVWITVDVYENDMAKVQRGASAAVNPRALPGETFRGRVTYAGGVVDTVSRTLKVRVEVENPTLRLRPGMFAQVRIAAQDGARDSPDTVMMVPDLAVQELNGRTVVFAPDGAPGRFVARSVTVGPRSGEGFVTIRGPLHLGDSVVTKGAFKLKAEMTKASFGEDES